MDVPSLPTDNLYKLMSLAGVWLFLLSLIGPQYLLRTVDEKLIDLSVEVAIYKIDMKYFDQRTADFEKSILREEKKEKPDAEKLKEELREIKIASKSNDILGAKIDGSLKRVEYYNNEVKRLNFISVFSASTSALVFLIGFYLWYVKIQKVDDRLRANQIES